MVLMTLRGTPFLYYGDEIGMTNVKIAGANIRDPVGRRHWSKDYGRDAGRTPMQWSGGGGAGFTDAGVEPWLPFGDIRTHNVADQKDDQNSILSLTRDLIRLRRDNEDLRGGAYELSSSPEKTWVFRRGKHTVALNMSGEDATIDRLEGTIVLGTDRSKDGTAVSGSVDLGAWEGVIVG